jgi:hypothetical protein
MQSVIQFLVSHQVLEGAVVVGVLDFLFAMNKSWESNGVLHWIYTTAKSFATKDQA